MNDQSKLKQQLHKISDSAHKLQRYSFLIFFISIAVIYGLLLLRISTLTNQQPSETQISQQVKASRMPHIDKSIIKQLQSLEDNSVSVKALFNQARSNPFQ